MRGPTINESLMIFAEEFTGENDWYTRAQLAYIINCSEASLPAAFTWLRQNGYVVDNRRVYTKKVNQHRIQRMDVKKLNKQVRRKGRGLAKATSLLKATVNRTLGKDVKPIRRVQAEPIRVLRKAA